MAIAGTIFPFLGIAISWGNMFREELIRQYENKPDIELLLTASNYDGGYTEDAVEAATSVLLSRHEHSIDIQGIWNEEVSRLWELDKGCSSCHRKEVAYSEKFYLCSEEELDLAKSVPGLLALTTLGIGYTQHKFSYVTLEFKLCSQCLFDRTDVSANESKPKISWEEYHKHPLCKLYICLGFTELSKKADLAQ